MRSALTAVEGLVKGILKGDKRSIARAITVAEDGGADAQKLIAAVYPHTGKAHVIGITGPGGAGKSTLVEKLVREYRKQGKTIGVVAVDPSSPFTGGAFLGDRIRMQELSTNEGVFIRSMATRSFAGGIARATKDAVRVLDAAGKDLVLVETVGAGQSEVEIVRVAQTILVVHAPGMGDEIQAIKAGIMEIGDIFVVNKADRESANKTVSDLQAILQLSEADRAWKPPVLKTVALTGEGVPELVEKVAEHKAHLMHGVGGERLMLGAENELIDAIKEKVLSSIIDNLRKEGKLEEYLRKIVKKEMDPLSAAGELLKEKGLE